MKEEKLFCELSYRERLKQQFEEKSILYRFYLWLSKKSKRRLKNKMNLKETIEKAKEVAKENYIKSIEDAHNPEYKRKWRKVERGGEVIAYALEGTPDKAFVLIFRKNKIVKAVNQAHETIKEFEIEE